jgi:MinD superfamily P-loop ATPase
VRIAVASGKGGTGKTSVTVNMALSIGKVQILDCDVEEPNVHILLRPTIRKTLPVELLVPKIIEERCNYCGECAKFCQFNALFVAGETAMVFPELCHSCGGCSIICPNDAIVEEPRQIGRIVKGSADDIDLVYGEINVGEALAVPIITAVKDHIDDKCTVILDSAPGSACPLVETVHGVDFCLLVTEPTPFGLHDLQVAVEVIQMIDLPMGVVINFAGIGDRDVYDYCENLGIPIMMEIPFDRRIAELYSKGTPFVEAMPEWKQRFTDLLGLIQEKLKK